MELFFDYLKSIILGIVQGITEWLPVSSTGHMILVNQFIAGLPSSVLKDGFFEMFLVVIQFGSILAVVTLYFNRLNPFSPKKTARQKKDTWTMWGKVLVACIPAGIIGILLDDFLNDHFYNAPTVAATLIIYGILFIVIESRNKKPRIKSIDEMSYKTALGIGAFQMLSLIPGTSRSGSTILGAVTLGTARDVAAEFSFFLAVPIMLGASVLKIAKYVAESGFSVSGAEIGVLLVGMAVAYLVSIAAIKFLMGYIRNHDFKAFGWYRIVVGILVILYFSVTGAQVV